MAESALSALFDGAQATRNKNCVVCGNELTPKQGRSKYCSRACGRVKDNEKRALKRREAGVAVVIGGMFSCLTCGATVEAKSPKSRYCPPCAKKSRLLTYKKQNNSPERRARTQRKLRDDPRYALDRRMGWAIWNSLKNGKAKRSWESLVGYKIDELFIHIERQFEPLMNWGNMGEWHVDHIIPRISFKYENDNDPEFLACWAITNLRPLWAKDNISKSNKRTLLL